MDGHAKAASAHRALVWIFGALLLALGGYGYYAKEPPPLGSLLASGALVFVFFVLHMLLARGARLRKPWARIGSLVVGFVLLAAFPVGTVFGVYLISNSLGAWPEPHTHAGAPRGAWPSDAVRPRARINDRG